MKGYDICRLLSHLPSVYDNLIGLFHLTELLSVIKCHEFAIINDSNHWAVVHNNLLNEIEVFDREAFNTIYVSKKWWLALPKAF